MARITMPSGFTGHIGSVKFTKGEGESDNPGMLAYFAKYPERFVITEPEQPEQPPVTPAEPTGDEDAPDPEPSADPEPEGDPYDVTVEELRKLAKAAGVQVAGSKAELQARLREHDEASKSE